MDTSETTTEPGRDVDVRTSERQPKRQRELDDVALSLPPREPVRSAVSWFMRTLPTTTNVEEGLMDENMRGEIGNVRGGGIAAISVHAANPDGTQVRSTSS